MFKTIEDMSWAVAKAASDKKARDIVRLTMKDVSSATDYFVICSANTPLQARAIADHIEDEMTEAGLAFLHKEGYREGEWILLDYGDCVAHIFTQDSREFYQLETLWSKAELQTYEE